MAKFGLEHGLYLEERGVLLRWGALPAELRGAEMPVLEVSTGGQGIRMYWRGGHCFGGLVVICVSTEFRMTHWPQERLRGLRAVFPSTMEAGGMAVEFKRGQLELERRFGPPLRIDVTRSSGEAEWRFDGVVLRHEFFDGWGSERCAYLFLDEDKSAN